MLLMHWMGLSARAGARRTTHMEMNMGYLLPVDEK